MKITFCFDFVFYYENCVNRGKKLKETLVAVQQLDKNMNNLRSWLAHIEAELSQPIAYDSCDFQEIQRKLDLQQVEKHSGPNQAAFILVFLEKWHVLHQITEQF